MPFFIPALPLYSFEFFSARPYMPASPAAKHYVSTVASAFRIVKDFHEGSGKIPDHSGKIPEDLGNPENQETGASRHGNPRTCFLVSPPRSNR
jgi:hypothetical protein